MNNMKKILRYIILSLSLPITIGCENMLDNNIDTSLKPEQIYVNYDRMKSVAMGAYGYAYEISGFYKFNNTLRACVSDEAEETNYSSAVQAFNLGSWGKDYNPDDVYATFYEGIRQCCLFIENSENYRQILATDTISSSGKASYEKQCEDIELFRQEIRFLRAFYYFELIKRYGGIPLVVHSLSFKDNLKIPRADFESCIDFIVNECDAVKDKVTIDWVAVGKPNEHGRVTKGTVLALKSRVLLYAASKYYNKSNDIEKWEKAAAAAKELIDMHKYGLYNDYQKLFQAPQSYNSNEVIFYVRHFNSNALEQSCYPIGTPGGRSGVTPTANLVDAYEKLKGWDASNPYEKVDPRMQMSIVVNNSNWNGRTIETFVGGLDGIDQKNASRTGYYLKKFLSPNLKLQGSPEGTSMKSWIVFRYGEILLNYAEAMNEAYGPDSKPNDYPLSSREAINQIRSRPSVNMPPVIASNYQEMKEAIERERRIELAFEDHRYWDLKRWGEGRILGEPIYGTHITQDTSTGIFSYQKVKVEERVFDESKMYLYPIPQSEINKYPDILKQNPGW
jgi:hypothetical protein